MLVCLLVLASTWGSIVLGFGILGFGLAGLLFVVLGNDRVETVPVRNEEEPADRFADHRRYAYPMVVLMGYFGA
jgi:multisubunit Na+/H+ antiporter MnhC subunit